MRIPKFNPRGVRPWMINHPLAARAFCLAILPLSPFIYGVAILWENRSGFSEIKMLAEAALLPWEEKP